MISSVLKLSCFVTVLGLALASGWTGSDDDPYSIRQVVQLLRQPAGFSTGASEKQLGRLGDRLAIALSKIYTTEELKTPENIEKFLPLLEEAFISPQLITIVDDRQPRVTMILLEYLRTQTHDSVLKEHILKTERSIQARSAE